jgi:hypothetical protein
MLGKSETLTPTTIIIIIIKLHLASQVPCAKATIQPNNYQLTTIVACIGVGCRGQ